MEVISEVEVFETPDKSPGDKKEYRLIRILSNQMKVLLISSSNIENKNEGQNAAVTLYFDVGGFYDTIPGLAHFVEHMIFMGSEKYPAENEFEKHLRKFGGNYNASTDNESTEYYFSVLEEGLDSSLDRFVSLFRAPLMLKDSINRERESVESEFQNSFNNDSYRVDHVLSELGNENHLSTTFVCGNSNTLKENITDDELYDKVHEFQQKYYVGNRAYMCIQSQLPLDDLQNLVLKHFSEFPAAEFLDPPLSENPDYSHEKAYKPEFHEKIFYVKPIDPKLQLIVKWCLPSYIKSYRSKPLKYVATILDDEGPGTLFSYLKKNLLASAIAVAGELEEFSTHSLFGIKITLTEYGYEQQEKVLDAVFSYLLLLETAGPNKDYFEKLQQFEANTFRFHEESSASSNTDSLAPRLKYHAPKDIVTGRMYLEYNEDEIKAIIKALNQKKFNIMFVSDKYGNYDRKEKWIGVEYAAVDFPENFNKLWDNRTLKEYFSIPGKNPFACSNFDIYYNKDDIKKNLIHPNPVKIMETELVDCYFRLDDKFLMPNAYSKILFLTPIAESSSKNYLLSELYEAMALHYLKETVYLLGEANYTAYITSGEKGISLTIDGHNEKIDKVFELFVNIIKELPGMLDEPTFNTYLEKKKKDYSSKILSYISVLRNVQSYIMGHSKYPNYVLQAELENIKFEDLKDFSEKWFKQFKMLCLFQGNILESQVIDIVQNICDSFDPLPMEDTSFLKLRCRKIEEGKNYLRIKSFLHNDKNSMVSNHYQVGPSSLELVAKATLFCAILREPLFDILRTQQQLGYSVSIGPDLTHKVIGIEIDVKCQENIHTRLGRKF